MMKHLRLLLLRVTTIFVLTFFFVGAQAQVQTARFISMGSNTNGYYEYLPQGYNTNTTQTYPLILFIHGMGELGDGSPAQLPKLLNTGVAASINVGEMPVSLTVNGQSFSFTGYLPVKEPARGQRIKQLEQHSKKENQTQMVIETPYRNNNLLQDLLKHCLPGTRICIAQNLTAPNQYLKTKNVTEWKKETPTLEKAPAVFLFLA